MKDKKYLWIIAILILAMIDQLIKIAVLKNINSSISVIPNILDLSYVENTGVAFGLRCCHRKQNHFNNHKYSYNFYVNWNNDNKKRVAH